MADWYYSLDGDEDWRGGYASRDVAVEEGRAGLDDERAEETQFYVALFERPEPFEYLLDAQRYIENAQEAGEEDGGEHAEDFPDVSNEAAKELDDFLRAWVAKHKITVPWLNPIGRIEAVPFEESPTPSVGSGGSDAK